MSHRQERKRRAEEFCQRYLSLWGIICIGCFFVFGWPALLAGPGAAWTMTAFLQLRQCHGNDSSRKHSRRPPCTKHR